MALHKAKCSLSTSCEQLSREERRTYLHPGQSSTRSSYRRVFVTSLIVRPFETEADYRERCLAHRDFEEQQLFLCLIASKGRDMGGGGWRNPEVCVV